MGHDNSFFATIMGHNILWFIFGWPCHLSEIILNKTGNVYMYMICI